MPLLSWSNACLAILYESCYHPVFCASIDGRSSRFITSINPRNATSLHPSPLNLMIAFSTLSKYLILWPKGPLRRRLSEMYWAQGLPPSQLIGIEHVNVLFFDPIVGANTFSVFVVLG